MNDDNPNDASEDEEYDEPHLIREEETTTHADFGGGIYKIEALVPCNHGGIHQKTVFVLAGSMTSALDVVLESFGAKAEADVTIVSATRIDSTESRFLVPRSFLENAEEHWIFRMRPRSSGEDHMN
jgi:hypothetical protein